MDRPKLLTLQKDPRLPVAAASLVLVGAALAACSGGGSSGTPSSSGSGGSGGASTSASSGGGAGSGGGFVASSGSGTGVYVPAPYIEASAPMNAPELFMNAGASSMPGACIIEPEPSALYPRNWLRPRFTWRATAGTNLHELRIQIPNQPTPVLVYTGDASWTMPADLWGAISTQSADLDLQVSVRSGTLANGALGEVAAGSSFSIRVAPVEAPGSIVYWSTTTKSLKGFQIGAESVVDVLKPSDFKERQIDCVGCHSSSPDGKFIGYATKLENPFDPSTEYAGAVTSLDPAQPGALPSFLGAGGKLALAEAFRGGIAFSAAHWKAGDRLVVTRTQPSDINAATTGELVWIDLEAPTTQAAQGVLARTGDTGVPVAMNWSHDGQTVVYTSSKAVYDSRADVPPIDIFTIPFNDRQGGAATPLAGAATAEYDELYPAFSPDDKLIAFTRVPTRTGSAPPSVFDPAREVLVIPRAGGAPTRLAANDPPLCSGKTSPGISNTYPKWAPLAQTLSGTTYYWLVFSSKRPESGHSQLFLTSLRVDGAGSVQSGGAVLLWNQSPDEDNHTPAWDYFQTPPPK